MLLRAKRGNVALDAVIVCGPEVLFKLTRAVPAAAPDTIRLPDTFKVPLLFKDEPELRVRLPERV